MLITVNKLKHLVFRGPHASRRTTKMAFLTQTLFFVIKLKTFIRSTKNTEEKEKKGKKERRKAFCVTCERKKLSISRMDHDFMK